MRNEPQIVADVYAAKKDTQKADDLIRAYLPFIRAEASRVLSRVCTEQEDEASIAMMAFYEAIMGYERGRGAFHSYAAMLIRSRLIDWQRKERRHRDHLSLDEGSDQDTERTLLETISDERDHYDERDRREATRQEIEELAAVMASFGLSFGDVAEHCPRQERTLDACTRAIRYAGNNTPLLDELLRTGKLPLARLAAGAGVERKTLERHRKYLLAMLLIQTNGYELIRGHLYHILKKGDA